MQNFYQQVLNRKLQMNDMYVRFNLLYRIPYDLSNNSSSYSSSASKNITEIKTEIFRSLPSVIRHQKDCVKNKACKLNKLLLDYFIHSELERMQPETPKEKISIQQQEPTPQPLLEIESKGKDKEESHIDEAHQSAQKVMLITKCPHTHRKHYAKVILGGI
jgi:hypothetical protein